MTLSKTIELMESKNYKERFKAEYYQLENRIEGLSNMLEKYKNGALDFTPKCSYDLLKGQLKAMKLYASYLKERAIIEEVEL